MLNNTHALENKIDLTKIIDQCDKFDQCDKSHHINMVIDDITKQINSNFPEAFINFYRDFKILDKELGHLTNKSFIIVIKNIVGIEDEYLHNGNGRHHVSQIYASAVRASEVQHMFNICQLPFYTVGFIPYSNTRGDLHISFDVDTNDMNNCLNMYLCQLKQRKIDEDKIQEKETLYKEVTEIKESLALCIHEIGHLKTTVDNYVESKKSDIKNIHNKLKLLCDKFIKD